MSIYEDLPSGKLSSLGNNYHASENPHLLRLGGKGGWSTVALLPWGWEERNLSYWS